MHIGKEIRRIRRQEEITQTHLAKSVGCSRQYLYEIERGNCIPNFKLICKIALILPLDLNLFIQKLKEEM